ncbi:hypothetical protein Tco_0151649 [Tanacetum coccineum]
MKSAGLLKEYNYADHMIANTLGVIPNTNVSIPQLKSNQLEDKVMSNNSQRNKQEVKDHRRSFNKKTVATDSTVKKSRNITRKLYEQVSKKCSWWYPKYTPPGYNWKPKSQIGNFNPNVSMPLENASRTANILELKTPRCSTASNTPLSSNSFAARRDNPIHHRLEVLKAHDRKSQTSN